MTNGTESVFKARFEPHFVYVTPNQGWVRVVKHHRLTEGSDTRC